MKRTFTKMEASPSAENLASAGVSSKAEAPVLTGGPSAMNKIPTSTTVEATSAKNEPPLSKNKLKKLKRDQDWEENREKRKVWRKEKLKQKKQRKRIAREEAAAATELGIDGSVNENPEKAEEEQWHKYRHAVQVPVTLVIDCGFDDLMVDTERKSLGSQLTRCYSDTQKAQYRAHLVVSSFGGHLKDRFDTVLSGQYKSWKGVRFLEDDFAKVASQAREWMKANKDSRITGALANERGSAQNLSTDLSDDGEIVYLTSDSPNTLTELRPYSTYIIGGIVDKNRHKGICFKKAMDQNIKTAKLPIGDYLQMTSRFVLTTNHVAEIMLRWLEVGDWGEAFLQVIPKRKGGMLKGKPVEEDEQTEAAPSNAGGVDEAAEGVDVANPLAAHMVTEAEDSLSPALDQIPNGP